MPSISDHSPCILPNVTFKFFSFWMEHLKHKDIHEEAWSNDVRGKFMFALYEKMKILKCKLKELNQIDLGDLLTKVLEAKTSFEQIQRATLSGEGH